MPPRVTMCSLHWMWQGSVLRNIISGDFVIECPSRSALAQPRWLESTIWHDLLCSEGAWRGWKNAPVITSMSWSCRGLRFGSQYPCSAVAPGSLGDSTPLTPVNTCTHVHTPTRKSTKSFFFLVGFLLLIFLFKIFMHYILIVFFPPPTPPRSSYLPIHPTSSFSLSCSFTLCLLF